MKIFGIEFKTRRELKERVAELENELQVVRGKYEETKAEVEMLDTLFPFALGQTVYDVQLRNEKGRYAKKNVSLEHSLINEVVVDEKNYFGLVERLKKNDVFFRYESARAFLESVCVK